MDPLSLNHDLPSLSTPSVGTLAADRGPTSSQRSFAEILSIADRGPLAAKQSPREVAETFVAVALVQPILAQARESGWAAPPFQPSQGEKQFGALMDAHLARELTRAARFPLVDRLARDMRPQ